MIDHGRFEVVLRRFTHDGNKCIVMEKTVFLPFAPVTGMELCISSACTFIVDEVWYSLERGTFRATDRTDRHGRRRALNSGADSWRDAGFEVTDWARERRVRSVLHVVREGPAE